MYFSSDNWAGAHPKIAESLSRHASGFSVAYGESALDKKIEAQFNRIFEREVSVFFVGTGTAANSLALSSLNRPGGVSFCHRGAHIIEDECGAPEFFSHGARLAPVDGQNGKLDPALLEREIARFPAEFIHAGQPMAVSITQASEIGTVYSTDEIDRISNICKAHGLPLHMDGARFANALASQQISPAEMTWRRGVDIMSFGATKNGCWCAEALVVFDPQKAREMPFLRKRAAHLFSKTRFISAQLEAYFEDDLWLEMASHANAMSKMLQEGITSSQDARLAWKADANEVFAIIPHQRSEAMLAAGAQFHEWKPPQNVADGMAKDEVLIRLVTSFATTRQHVEQFVGQLN